MTTPAKIQELPLSLVGVSDQVTDWLEQAGIPVARLGQDSITGPAFGQAIPARCLLFDSRDIASRSVVNSHQFPGCYQIDIAAWVASKAQRPLKVFKKNPIPLQPARLDFLERLKKAIESEGGLWARLADFPFPYQGVVCLNGEWPRLPLPHQIDTQGPHGLDAIQERYIQGLPSMVSVSDLSDLAELPPVTGLQSRGLPLLWRTNPKEFAAWWQVRNHLDLKLWQSRTHFHVACRKTNSAFCPVLEIWRGNHLASVPLRSESLVIKKDGLVFQQQPARHPAGFTAGWPDMPFEAASARLPA